MLAGRIAVKLQDADCKAILVYSVQKEIWKSHQHRKVCVAIGVEPALVFHELPVDKGYGLFASLRSGVDNYCRYHHPFAIFVLMVEVKVAPHKEIL